MRYTQYKGVVEREYKKSLRKIMYELCVIEGLDSVNGALRLGVAKTIFEYWRYFYRYDDHQRLFDQKVQELDKMHFLYINEEKKENLQQALLHTEESSLSGFKEQVGKMTAYYRQIHTESNGLAVEASNLPLFEYVEELLQRYEKGELLEEVMNKSSKRGS